MHVVFRNSIYFLKAYNQSFNLFRGVRSASKRISVMKTLKDFKIKNTTDIEEYDDFVDYKEISTRIKENDLDIEETFTKGEDFETVISESSKMYDIHISESKKEKAFIKKKLIGRKYFHEGKETNLLTHAAKEQIRYLAQLNSTDWTPESLSKSFPISVTGVKKLLKSNYIQTCPEIIKAHDEDVKRKWDILMSGKHSGAISSHTQNLWEAGKLLRENYNGNSNLPKVSKSPPQKTVTKIKQHTGEYAAIVQKYVEHKAQKESSQSGDTEIKNSSDVKNTENEQDIFKHLKKSKYFKDENIRQTFKNQFDEAEIPFSQFKENLKSELKFKSHKSSTGKQYYQWIEQDSKENDIQYPEKPYIKEFIAKIPKYNTEKIETMSNKSFYEKFNTKDQNIKRKIHIPAKLQNKKSTYKVGKCVFDKDGEFLYKLPC